MHATPRTLVIERSFFISFWTPLAWIENRHFWVKCFYACISTGQGTSALSHRWPDASLEFAGRYALQRSIQYTWLLRAERKREGEREREREREGGGGGGGSEREREGECFWMIYAWNPNSKYQYSTKQMWSRPCMTALRQWWRWWQERVLVDFWLVLFLKILMKTVIFFFFERSLNFPKKSSSTEGDFLFPKFWCALFCFRRFSEGLWCWPLKYCAMELQLPFLLVPKAWQFTRHCDTAKLFCFLWHGQTFFFFFYKPTVLIHYRSALNVVRNAEMVYMYSPTRSIIPNCSFAL